MNGTYTVYMHTCPNDKVYIGITKRKPSVRWNNGKGYQHNEYFSRAIEKYGWESFKHEILFENLSKEEAEQREIELIKKYKSTDPSFGFNILSGGDARQGLCGSLNGMYGVSLRGELNGMHGKKHTEETKQKISDALKGRSLSEKQKEMLSEMFSGELNPMYGVHRFGENNPFYGRRHTEEARAKISEARKGRFRGADNYNARKVICLTTNEVFGSLSEAVAKYKINQGNLSLACCNPRRTCGKKDGIRLKWMYYDDYISRWAM